MDRQQMHKLALKSLNYLINFNLKIPLIFVVLFRLNLSFSLLNVSRTILKLKKIFFKIYFLNTILSRLINYFLLFLLPTI